MTDLTILSLENTNDTLAAIRAIAAEEDAWFAVTNDGFAILRRDPQTRRLTRDEEDALEAVCQIPPVWERADGAEWIANPDQASLIPGDEDEIAEALEASGDPTEATIAQAIRDNAP